MMIFLDVCEGKKERISKGEYVFKDIKINWAWNLVWGICKAYMYYLFHILLRNEELGLIFKIREHIPMVSLDYYFSLDSIKNKVLKMWKQSKN